ncbi:MAG: fluoride efflux transporter CrcB [Jatrophihabitans sp.]|nr:MAG: fluoride efflux transporter CrcB [Jatrophihabitans sp.]
MPSAPRRWDVLAAVTAGGVAGAEARYGLGLLLPAPPAAFPWATLLINVSGCLLIGALMVTVLELTSPHRLARPLLGVGVLGGYTTFSTFTVEVLHLARAGRAGIAVAYLVVSVVGCVIAVAAGTMGMRALALGLRRARRRSR